eukprot:150741_1
MYCIIVTETMLYQVINIQFERAYVGILVASTLITVITFISVHIIRILFQWSKPTIVKSCKKKPNVTEEQKMQSLISLSELEEMKHMHDIDATNRGAIERSYWSAINKLKTQTKPDMRLVRKCMHYVNTQANSSSKVGLESEIRSILFNYNYPLPTKYKKITWTLLVLICFLCIVIAVFDESSSSQRQQQRRLIYWLFVWFASICIWQPLLIYILSWITIWAFHQGLSINKAIVYNMWMCLCSCCQAKKKQNKNTTFANTTFVAEDSEMYELSVPGSSGFAVVGNEDMALDVIGFLCNDELFVDLPDDFESSYVT